MPSPPPPSQTDSQHSSFHLSGMIADNRRNLGRVGKTETLRVFRIYLRLSQMIRDVCDYVFSQVGDILPAKSRIV